MVSAPRGLAHGHSKCGQGTSESHGKAELQACEESASRAGHPWRSMHMSQLEASGTECKDREQEPSL